MTLKFRGIDENNLKKFIYIIWICGFYILGNPYSVIQYIIFGLAKS